MTREAWQAEVRRVISRPKFVTSRSTIADGAQLDAVPIPPSPDSSKSLLGVLLDGVVQVSNSGTNSFVITNANGGSALDFFFQRVRVLPDEGGTARSKTASRRAIELFEQISLNMNKRLYPSGTKHIATLAAGAATLPTTNKLAGSKTGFVSSEIFVPVGGKSCAIQIDVPALPIIGAGTTNTAISAKGVIATSSRTINYKAVYGNADEVITFDSRITQSLALNGDNSLLEYQVKNMAPDYVGYANKFYGSQVIMEGANEVLANFRARDFPFQQGTVPDLAPTYQQTATAAANTVDALWVATNKKRFSTHVFTTINTNVTVTLELLSISWDGGSDTTSPAAPKANTTPSPASSKNVPGPGGNSTSPRAGGMLSRR